MPVRRTHLDEPGSLQATKGSREWCVAVLREAKAERKQLESDARSLGQWLNALRKVEAWKVLDKLSWSTLLVDLDLTDEQADALITSKKGDTVGAVIARAESAKALSKHGGDRKSGEEQGNNITLKRGTDPNYLTARIARDRPDILERMKAGEFKSVRAAAIEAGIVKPDTPLVLLQRAWKRADEKERTAFLKWTDSTP